MRVLGPPVEFIRVWGEELVEVLVSVLASPECKASSISDNHLPVLDDPGEFGSGAQALCLCRLDRVCTGLVVGKQVASDHNGGAKGDGARCEAGRKEGKDGS